MKKRRHLGFLDSSAKNGSSLADNLVRGERGSTLPDGWEERKDGYGRTFFFNSLTKQSCWRRPKQIHLPRRFRSNCARLGLYISQPKPTPQHDSRNQGDIRGLRKANHRSGEMHKPSRNKLHKPQLAAQKPRGFRQPILNSDILVTLRSEEDSLKLLKAIYTQEVEDASLRNPSEVNPTFPSMATVSRLVRQEGVAEESYFDFVRRVVTDKNKNERMDKHREQDLTAKLISDQPYGDPFAVVGSRKVQKYKDDMQQKLDHAKRLRELKGTKAGRLEQAAKDEAVYYDARTNTFKPVRTRRRTSSLIVGSKGKQSLSTEISEVFTIPVRSLTPTSKALRGADTYFGGEKSKLIESDDSLLEDKNLEERLRFADKLSIHDTTKVESALSSYLSKNTTASYVLGDAEKAVLDREKYTVAFRKVESETIKSHYLPNSAEAQVISSSEIERYIDRLNLEVSSQIQAESQETKEEEVYPVSASTRHDVEDLLFRERSQHAKTRQDMESLKKELEMSKSTCRELVQTCDFLTIEGGKAVTSFKSQQRILADENLRLLAQVEELQNLLKEFDLDRTSFEDKAVEGEVDFEKLSHDRLVRVKVQMDKIFVLESVVRSLERENSELEKLKQCQTLEIRTLRKTQRCTGLPLHGRLPMLRELQCRRMHYLESQVSDFDRALKQSLVEGQEKAKIILELQQRQSRHSSELKKCKGQLTELRAIRDQLKSQAEIQKLESEELLQKQFATLKREQAIRATQIKEEFNEKLFRASRKASLALSSAVQQVRSELNLKAESAKKESRALTKRLQRLQERDKQKTEHFSIALEDKESLLFQVENELNNAIVSREVDLMNLKRTHGIMRMNDICTQSKQSLLRSGLRQWVRVTGELKCEEIIEVYGSALDRTTAVHNLCRVLETWRTGRMRVAFRRIRDYKRRLARTNTCPNSQRNDCIPKQATTNARPSGRPQGRKYYAPRPGAHFLLCVGVRLSRIENMVEKKRLFRLHKSWMKLKSEGRRMPNDKTGLLGDSHFKISLKSHALREEIRALHDQLAAAKAEAWSYKRKLITQFESKSQHC